MQARDENDVLERVREAVAKSRHLQCQGGGSKRDVGAPIDEADVIDLRGLHGIVEYDPSELVLTARAGTPLHRKHSGPNQS